MEGEQPPPSYYSGIAVPGITPYQQLTPSSFMSLAYDAATGYMMHYTPIYPPPIPAEQAAAEQAAKANSESDQAPETVPRASRKARTDNENEQEAAEVLAMIPTSSSFMSRPGSARGSTLDAMDSSKSEEAAPKKEAHDETNGTSSQPVAAALAAFAPLLEGLSPDDQIAFASQVLEILTRQNLIASALSKRRKLPPETTAATPGKYSIPNEHLPKKKRRTKNDRISDDLIFGDTSPLLDIDLRQIFTEEAFNLLSPEEKDSLLVHLPWVDTDKETTIKSVFMNRYFVHGVNTYKQMLDAGQFSDNWESRFRRPEMDAWKKKHFEEYWGQHANDNLYTGVNLPLVPRFSFVQQARKRADEGLPPLSTPSSNTISSSATNNSGSSLYSRGSSYPTKKYYESDSFEEYDSDKDFKPKNPQGRRPNVSPGSTSPSFRTTGSRPGRGRGGKSVPVRSAPISTSYREGAEQVLRRIGQPLTPMQIYEQGLTMGVFQVTGKTPVNSLSAVLYVEVKNPSSPFVKQMGKACFGLREWGRGDEFLSDGEHEDESFTPAAPPATTIPPPVKKKRGRPPKPKPPPEEEVEFHDTREDESQEPIQIEASVDRVE